MEHQALTKEGEKAKERIAEIDSRARKAERTERRAFGKWHTEKIKFETLHQLRQKVDNLKQEAETAERDGNLERVAEITYGELPQAEKDFQIFEKKNFGGGVEGEARERRTPEERFLKEAVDKEDVAAIVSVWTGIPLKRMLESDTEKMVKIEDVLRGRVVGQEEAITAVASSLCAAPAPGFPTRTAPSDRSCSLGRRASGRPSLPARSRSSCSTTKKRLIRVDMSEYMERHATSRLIGSPPGYVGYDEGGQLTEMVRHRPYSLILFDEIEKAHPEVFNLLLQVLDNGRLTDSKGKIVNFKNSIIIMTSNVGSEHLKAMSRIGFSAGANAASEEENDFRKKTMDALKHGFRPEFLNRIDEIVIFNPLHKQDLEKIVDIQLALVAKQLHDGPSYRAHGRSRRAGISCARRFQRRIRRAAAEAFDSEGYS